MAESLLPNNQLDSAPRNLARLIDHLRLPGFPERLIDFLATLCRFDASLIVIYKPARQPILIHPLDPAEQSSALHAYLDSGYYLLDPLFNAIQNGLTPGLVRLSEIAPDSFKSSEFYQNCYQYFGIVDEVVLIIALDADSTAAISLSRRAELGSITRRERKALQTIESVIGALFRQFWQLQSGEFVQYEQPDDAMKQALRSFGQGVLTLREREIVELVLKGHSSKAIAERLGISPGTVKVHRKNIHARLHTSTQSELFNLFLSHLQTQTD